MYQFPSLLQFCVDNDITYEMSTDEKFHRFFHFLIEKNKVMNLTAVTEKDDVELLHFIDSLEGVPLLRELSSGTVKILDLGTGAGFPGIPLALTLSDAEFVLADALQKRISFLDEVTELLSLNHVCTIHARAEELGHSDLRETFHFCVSRAVANTSVLLEYMLPMVKIGGYALLYKSGDYQEEINSAANALVILGGEIKKVHTFCLPDSEIHRSILVINKTRETPEKYPRKPGKPSKSPL